jgi:5-(carboxyamino)imidazole ribonucleotide mutase
MSENSKSLVAVIMGSKSDWEVMRSASETFTEFGVPHESRVLSAHRTPELAAELPVLGVPMESASLKGMDSLLSTVQMPAGVPVGTLAIGKPGAKNAALLAIAILANSRPELRAKLHRFREEQKQKIAKETLP